MAKNDKQGLVFVRRGAASQTTEDRCPGGVGKWGLAMNERTSLRVLVAVLTLTLLAGGVALASGANSRRLAQALTNRQAVYATSGVSVTDLDNGTSADQLAQSLAGPGVSVSNVPYTGDSRAAGSFTSGL